MRKAILAALASAPLFSFAATADDPTVTVDALVKGLDTFVGKKVVISDCVVLSANSIVGAQCSVLPVDGKTLVYVDSDTWVPAAGKIFLEQCPTTDLKSLCQVKVTGEVSKNGRGQAVVKKATAEIVKKVSGL